MQEIYYANGRDSVLSDERTKPVLLGVIIFSLLSVVLYFFSFSNNVTWVVLFSLAVLADVAFLLFFSYRARIYFQWKKGVNSYLKELSKYGKYSLNLNAYTFELINGDKTEVEKWKNIKKATFLSTYIQLESESGSRYVFPAKSIEPSKYEALKEFIRRKMNDPSIIEETILSNV